MKCSLKARKPSVEHGFLYVPPADHLTGNHVRQYRRTSIQDFKQIEARRSSDETIFRNKVTLQVNIQIVSERNETERKRVLDVFRKHGVTRLPDGRRMQDIVTTAW